MQTQPDNISGPTESLRAEGQQTRGSNRSGHIEGVAVSSAGLFRATLGSAIAAAGILAVFWLPAEYGVDPTGIGRALGLTQMGEIKQQLYDEAAAEDAVLAAQAAAEQVAADPLLLARLDAIEAELASLVATLGGAPILRQAPVLEPSAPLEFSPEAAASAVDVVPEAPAWRDEVSYTLAPAEGIEVKLAMTEGAMAEFEWTANGAVLNYDTHGDGGGQRITYERGRGVPGQTGELVAAFTGNHGWFWRNRTDAPVTFTVRTRGDYSQMIAP